MLPWQFVDSLGERLAQIGNALWQGYAKNRQTLACAMRKLGFDPVMVG